MFTKRLLACALFFYPAGIWANDSTPPTDAITSLKEGDVIGGIVRVTADANDDVGVVSVTFFKGAALVES